MRYWEPRKIPGSPKVGIGVASWFFDRDHPRAELLRTLVASFRSQTYKNWELRIFHDGPTQHDHSTLKFVDEEIQTLGLDNRIKFIETDERKQAFGHPHRQTAITELSKTCEWLLLTNDDNYYVPVFLEWMLSAALAKPKCRFVHCDMVHSHKLWKKYFPTEPRYKHLDLGGFLVHRDVAKKIKFDNFAFNGDGDWINRLAKVTRPNIVHVPATLFVHN